MNIHRAEISVMEDEYRVGHYFNGQMFDSVLMGRRTFMGINSVSKDNEINGGSTRK